MNTAEQVTELIKTWRGQYSKQEIIVKAAEACLGWSYVWGGYGQFCTPANRRTYANRSSISEGEAAEIIKKCQQLNGLKSTCNGCKYYPGGQTRFFDCRGFTGWLLQQIDFKLVGAGATSQWNTASNWSAKGLIENIPMNQVCCVFMMDQKDKKTMQHTGMHIGGGVIIHDSGEVKYGKTTDRGWTHFAIPKGLEGGDVPVPVWRPTVRKGSSGEDVVYVQKRLMELGYSLSPYGADGKFGNVTLSAVKAFQTDHNLNPDGVVGPLTYEALEQASPVPVTKLYTVTIPNLTKDVADEIKRKYPMATVTEGDG